MSTMRVAGIAVKIPTKGRPSIRLVVMTNNTAPSIDQFEEFSSDHTDLAEQRHDAAEAIRSRLIGLDVERVVVRRADRAPVPASKEGPRIRLLAEGAVISAARSVVVDTRVGAGKELASWRGSNKADLDDEAGLLSKSHGLSAGTYAEAVGAGLAALAL
jgi:hypothetical protein